MFNSPTNICEPIKITVTNSDSAGQADQNQYQANEISQILTHENGL